MLTNSQGRTGAGKSDFLWANIAVFRHGIFRHFPLNVGWAAA